MIMSSIPFYPSKQYSHDMALTWTAWPAIDELWKVKRRHTAALKMTREPVGMHILHGKRVLVLKYRTRQLTWGKRTVWTTVFVKI